MPHAFCHHMKLTGVDLVNIVNLFRKYERNSLAQSYSLLKITDWLNVYTIHLAKLGLKKDYLSKKGSSISHFCNLGQLYD